MTFVNDSLYEDLRDVRVDTVGWGYKLHSRIGANGADLLRSVAGRFFGAGLMMAALGLWLMPGAQWGADVFAMKAAVTLAFVFLATVCFRAATRQSMPEVHVDMQREEIRFVNVRGGVPHMYKFYRFSELGDMRVRNKRLFLTDPSGARLASVDLDPLLEIAA